MLTVDENTREYFYKRTTEHIGRVIDNGKYLFDCIAFNAEADTLFKTYLESLPEYPALVEKLEKHDHTKFLPENEEGYILITEFYREDESVYSEEQERKAKEASYYHITHERHHPEFFTLTDQFDLNEMDTFDILEMLSDLHAMTQELGGSTKEYFNNNHKKKFKFNVAQLNYITNLLDILEPGME